MVSGQIIDFNGNAAAFAANVTVDETGLSGFGNGAFLRLYPEGGSSTTSFLNYGPGTIVANAGVISVNQTDGYFTVFASKPANVIIDNYGLFMFPQATTLDCTPVDGTPVSLAAGSVADAHIACSAGYTATGGACLSSQYGMRIVSTSIDATTHFWSWTNEGASSATGTPRVMCCRTPER